MKSPKAKAFDLVLECFAEKRQDKGKIKSVSPAPRPSSFL